MVSKKKNKTEGEEQFAATLQALNDAHKTKKNFFVIILDHKNVENRLCVNCNCMLCRIMLKGHLADFQEGVSPLFSNIEMQKKLAKSQQVQEPADYVG